MIIGYNHKIIGNNGNMYTYNAPPAPSYPSDMDFIYLANNFDGSQIPNAATGTNAFGPYLTEGTITKNDSGANCYLSNGLNSSNRLYYNLTNEQLNKMKPVNNGDTYSFFIRAYQNTSRTTSGILSWRTTGYIYMIRCYNGRLQLHTSTAYNLSNDFLLTSDKVYKVIVTKNNGTCRISAKNLNTGVVSSSYTYSPDMQTKMVSFTGYATGGSEANTDAIYGLAGIPRATTAYEDAIIMDILINQNI